MLFRGLWISLIFSLIGGMAAPAIGQVAVAAPATWPRSVAATMGIPEPEPGTLAVHVWTIGANRLPWMLYRIVQDRDRVIGEVFVWYRVSDGEYQASKTAGQQPGATALDFYRNHYCTGPISQFESLLWCPATPATAVDWSAIFKALPIAEMWTLPAEQSREVRWAEGRGLVKCEVTDGQSVGIELRDSDRYHFVEYHNPERCCPGPECRTAVQVLDIVRNAGR